MVNFLNFCVIFIFFSNKFITGKLLYFPSTNVEMTLIGKQNKMLELNETTIFIARTYTEPTQSSLQDNIQYRNKNLPNNFIFHNNTGEIKITQDFFLKVKDQELCNIEIFAIDLNNLNRNATFKMKILVKLLRNEDFNCEKYVNHLCFWPQIKYQVLENQQPSFLGLLSSQYYKNKCKNYHLYYTVSKGKMKIKLEQQQFSKTWYLLTNVSLDRDMYSNMGRSANFPATINCLVNNTKMKYEHSTAKTIHVEILDEDDNPLVPQVTPVVDVCLNSTDIKKDENLNFSSHLLFDDGDTYDVNNYETQILQDYENLLNVSCKKIENHILFKTAYFCEMQFRKDFTFKALPYTTLLQITDTSLGQMYGNRTIIVTIQIKQCDMKNMQRPSELSEHTTKATHGEMYPFIETKILRTAAPYARVAQPSDTIQNIHLFKFQIKHDSSWRLTKNKMLAAFNITAKNGIIYVQNSDILKLKTLSNVELTIEWSFENDSKNHGKWSRGTDLLRITIVDELNVSCADFDNDVEKWAMCATFDTVKKCHEACGLATGGFNTLKHVHKFADRGTRCTWRGNGTKSTVYQTEDYQTCTPDIKTCPDSICDQLEQLHMGICPQDCTKESVLWGDHNANNQGIQLGYGVCTCDETAKCVCGNFGSSGKHKKQKEVGVQTNLNDAANARKQFLDLNVHKAQSAHKCGPLCLAGIGLGVTLVTIIVGILICRVRAWRNMGIREHKYISSVTALSHGYSSGGGDYVHQTTSTNNTSLTPGSIPGNGLEFNFTMNVSISKKYTPDPKWEFPRQNLQIEQILGEGEFGRVLKARARDIGGIIGHTTVAVKTLKEYAQGSELDDLISEYELLKEVSHPNVIRLLGVSMLPGGPAYLIIEYAEFGSLRNYLRKSRHLEVENINLKCHEYNLVPAQPPIQEEVFTVTAKDILSFAWQISKGMAYLGDKKLVHRDLAARNVLVASGKICKISDFGLTRDVYEDNAYLKRSKGRVPIKWMAPESLADHVYTNRSDVWSFGILLWELVTLGGSPYPGVAVENLFTLLRSGYRMEKPPNCSSQLYSVMQKCWEIDPVERPSFRSLTEKFETMLEDGVEYLNLNLHTVQNKAYFSTLSDTSNPTSDESKQLNIPKYGNDCISPKNKDPFIVNLNESKMALPKCGEVEKLPIWAVSQSTSPTLKLNDYQNENNQIGMSHYEIPKNPNHNNRNNNILSTNLVSTNDNKIHLSYIDMTSNATTNQNIEEKPLLRTQSYDNLPSQQKITQV